MKEPPDTAILRIIAVAVLLATPFLAVPYSYFRVLRWVVTITASVLLFRSWSRKTLWSWIFGAVAILFNPIAPIYLSRTVWSVVDVVTAGAFAFSIYFDRAQATPISGTDTPSR